MKTDTRILNEVFEAYTEHMQLRPSTQKRRDEVAAAWKRINAAIQPRTLVIECGGGLTQDVHGMPEGWTYEIADWDNIDDNTEDAQEHLENGTLTTETLEKMIADARAQN